MLSIDEVNYCGTCQSQSKSADYRCRGCGGPTVIWNTAGRETAKAIHEKWERQTGKRVPWRGR